jgi:hypothetical protein
MPQGGKDARIIKYTIQVREHQNKKLKLSRLLMQIFYISNAKLKND